MLDLLVLAIIVYAIWSVVRFVFLFLIVRVNRKRNLAGIETLKSLIDLTGKSDREKSRVLNSIDDMFRTKSLETGLIAMQTFYGFLCALCAAAAVVIIVAGHSAETHFMLAILIISLVSGFKLIRIKLELVMNHFENIKLRDLVENQEYLERESLSKIQAM